MNEQQKKLQNFSNAILGDWESAMDRFFDGVVEKAKKQGLTNGEVEKALQQGYGDEVAESWVEWIEEMLE